MSHTRSTPRYVSIFATAATLAAVAWGAPAASAAPAQQAFALSNGNLVTFDPATPSATTTKAITGVTAGESLVGIDVRPQNGQLYALGVNAAANTASLYVIGRSTGVAGLVGSAPSSIAFVPGLVGTTDLPEGEYGFDFNPTVDRIRVTAASGALNFRVNPNTGGPVDGDNGGAAGSALGTNPDGDLKGETTSVSGSAYTDSRQNATATTLYSLSTANDSLTIQNPANGGNQVSPLPIKVGGAAIDFTAVGGFDIDPAVSAPASNAAVASGTGYATLTVGGTTRLYAIDLTTGNATAVGNLDTGSVPVQGLALQSDADDAGHPTVALSADGATISRFATKSGSAVTANVTGLAAGETLVGIALRPQTGQYYALGVDSGTDDATLYVIDPQSGALTRAGASDGLVAWDKADGTDVDLPAASAGWDIDFNPTVDRIRVVADGGLNARINPINGAAVDGDLGGAAGSVTGVNPDGAHNPLPAGATGVTATSYTNSFTQSLTGGVTTQYDLEPTSNQLFIQNPPNAGGLAAGKTITEKGAPLDFTSASAFDIPGDVSVATSATAASGSAIAALEVGPNTYLFSLDLSTAVATLIRNTSSLSSLAVGDAYVKPPVAPTPAPTPTPGPTPTPTPGPGLNGYVPKIANLGKLSDAKLKRSRVARVKGRTLDTGYSVTCPGAFNGPCEAKVKVTITKPGKLTLATKTIKVDPYRAKKLTVTLSKAGAASLKRNGRLSATVAITGEFGKGGKVTTTRKTSVIRPG